MRAFRRVPATRQLAIGDASVREDAISMRRESLAAIGVVDRVVVRLDRAARSIGFSKPRGEAYTYGLTLQTRDSRCCSISTGTAIRSIGLEPKTVAGRYQLEACDGVLWIRLEERNTPDAAFDRISVAIDAALQPLSTGDRAAVAARVATALERYLPAATRGRRGELERSPRAVQPRLAASA